MNMFCSFIYNVVPRTKQSNISTKIIISVTDNNFIIFILQRLLIILKLYLTILKSLIQNNTQII